MKALVLAAGYATRLYPLTKDYPKPLLKVGSRHIIDYIIEKLSRVERIDEILVITNSRFFSHFKRWGKRVATEKKLTLVDDLTRSLSDRRGAIGDMFFAIERKKIDDDLLVIGGDNLFDGNLEKFLAFTCRHGSSPVVGVYKLKKRKEASKYGVAKLNRNFRVIDFKEKPQKPQSSLVAMCLYYFPKSKIRLIREYMLKTANKQDATGFYIDWLRRKVPVYGFVFEGRWFDIGDRHFYQKAKENFFNL